MSIKVGIRCDNGVARIKIRRFQPTRRDATRRRAQVGFGSIYFFTTSDVFLNFRTVPDGIASYNFSL